MSARKVSRAWSVGFYVVLALGMVVLFAPQSADAQTNPTQPSCCNCHIWEDPVVEQGEWHTIHALQKCCSACHGGNDHATDQQAAHAGLMRQPLNNPDASCLHCHPADYPQRTAGVAVALGLTPDSHEPTPASPAADSTPAPHSVTLLPSTSFRGWDWPVELAVAIVVLGLGVMRWRRVHSG